MVKSDLCWLTTVEKGDCDFDHGGYFLIKGAEKVRLKFSVQFSFPLYLQFLIMSKLVFAVIEHMLVINRLYGLIINCNQNQYIPFSSVVQLVMQNSRTSREK